FVGCFGARDAGAGRPALGRGERSTGDGRAAEAGRGGRRDGAGAGAGGAGERAAGGEAGVPADRAGGSGVADALRRRGELSPTLCVPWDVMFLFLVAHLLRPTRPPRGANWGTP